MLLLVLLLPLAGAVGAVGAGHRDPRAVRLLATVPLAVTWVLAVVVASEHWSRAAASRYTAPRIHTGAIAIRPALSVDQLTASMLVLATTVALLVQVYSITYMRRDPRYPTYAAFVLLFTSAMTLVVSADDFFVLLVGWEVMGACSYFLIAHYWERAPARRGAMKAFLVTRLGDVGLLFGIFAAGRAAGTYRISGLLDAARDGRVSSGQATAVCLLLLCGVVGKSAQFPLHTWLPDAMPGPTPITALIHAATMVAAGVYLVARLEPLFVRSTVALDALAAIAVVTMVISAGFALVAEDLKRVLAWSTVSQLAMMFAALSLHGYQEGVVHLLSHGAFKALLFLAAGSVILVTGRQQLGELGGLRRAMPITFATMTVGLAALAGIPPFVGFFSKDAIVALALHEAHAGSGRAWVVLAASLATVVLTAAYSARVWLLVFFGTAPPREELADSPSPEPSEAGPFITVPLVLLAIVVLVGGVGVLEPGFLDVSRRRFEPWAMLVSTVAAVIALLVTYLAWRRAGRQDPAPALGWLLTPLRRELDIDRAVDAVVVRGVAQTSLLVDGAEREAIATNVVRTERLFQRSGRALRRLHAGQVTGYLTAVAIGAVAIAVVIGLVQG